MTKLDFSLRPPLETDVWPYIGFLADPEVSLWLEDVCQGAVTYAQIYALLFGEKRQIRSIEVRGKFVGLTGLSEWDTAATTGRFFFVIGDKKYWNLGLGRAVLWATLKMSFGDLALRRVDSDFLDGNQVAKALHEQIGFRVDGKIRQDCWRNGKWCDRILVSLLRDEYAELTKLLD